MAARPRPAWPTLGTEEVSSQSAAVVEGFSDTNCEAVGPQVDELAVVQRDDTEEEGERQSGVCDRTAGWLSHLHSWSYERMITDHEGKVRMVCWYALRPMCGRPSQRVVVAGLASRGKDGAVSDSPDDGLTDVVESLVIEEDPNRAVKRDRAQVTRDGRGDHR